MNKATQDLKRENTSVRKAKLKEDVEAAGEARRLQEEAAKQSAEEAKKKMATQKNALVFSMSLPTLNVRAVQVIDGDELVRKHLAKKFLPPPYSEPFIVTGSALVEQLFQDETMKTSIGFWMEKFGDSKEAKATGKTQAPLSSSHGVSACEAVMDMLIKSESMVPYEAQAPLITATRDCWIYGYLPSMVACDFEPDFLGSARIQLCGATTAGSKYKVASL